MAVRKVGATHKKKSKKPVVRRRRRRVSGAHDMSGMVMKAGGLVVGSVAGRELNTLLVKFFPSLATSPMLSGAMQMAVGYFLPKFVKGSFVAAVGDGMIANGGMVIIVSTGIINGVGDVASYRIGEAGTSYLKAVGGTSNLKVINGMSNRVGNRPVQSVKRNFPQYG